MSQVSLTSSIGTGIVASAVGSRGSATPEEPSVPEGSDQHEEPNAIAKRWRLPDDPCGGTLDVSV